MRDSRGVAKSIFEKLTAMRTTPMTGYTKKTFRHPLRTCAMESRNAVFTVIINGRLMMGSLSSIPRVYTLGLCRRVVMSRYSSSPFLMNGKKGEDVHDEVKNR
jgi:hypothetical protein